MAEAFHKEPALPTDRQQTAFGSQTLTYDDNGNLTSDGTNTYTWNVRNQLVSMSGPGLSASFAYDAVGRRRSKTINGATTSFLYDGANIVQEQVGGSSSANTLTGGIDQFFSRSDYWRILDTKSLLEIGIDPRTRIIVSLTLTLAENVNCNSRDHIPPEIQYQIATPIFDTDDWPVDQYLDESGTFYVHVGENNILIDFSFG